MADPIQTARIVEATRDAIGRVLRKHGPWDRLADASAWHVLNEAAQAALSTAYPMIREEMAKIESGWLIEEEAGGFVHWIALAEDQWPRTKVRTVGSQRRFEAEGYLSPIRRVKDANEALRFARKEDAEAVIRLFNRFLLSAKATEHQWPSAIRTTELPLAEKERE